ncbi:MAG: leucyl/phenylalanyl-tRNA--protein transferase, partial [Deltaproteobacteria bacterium]|nr:leucyl/phenylalanyl-tRNA--protein transferase [Deltaproteobacteria bacterium]
MQRPSFFPDPETADATGLVAVTDHIDTDLLLDAYSHGIFPWSENPVCWYSPDPRAVFLRGRARAPRKLGKIMRHHGFRVSLDTAFVPVMQACAEAH